MNTKVLSTASHLLLVLFLVSRAAGQSSPTASPGTFAGWTTNNSAAYRMYGRVIQTLPGPALSYRPLSTNLPLQMLRDFLTFRASANLTIIIQTNKVFDHILPESLNWFVWTNVIAHTNGKSTLIWTVRSRPPDWPRSPPTVRWNTHALLWAMKGFTAISPCNEIAVNPGQVPITALTRRHGYTLGHAMGPDRIGTLLAGKKVWFLTAQNRLVQTTIKREIVRTSETSRRDYTLVIFSSDLPGTIEPMRVISPNDVFSVPHSKFCYIAEALCPVFQTEQTGNLSAGVPGFTLDTGKGGDSGSPNMLPLLGELAFFNGRTTSGPSPEMQADMDTLCRLEGLDPRQYQLQWVDLSAFPTYPSD